MTCFKWKYSRNNIDQIKWEEEDKRNGERRKKNTATHNNKSIWQENVRFVGVYTHVRRICCCCCCYLVLSCRHDRCCCLPVFVFTLRLFFFFALCSHFSVRCWLENSLCWKSCFVVCLFFFSSFLTSSLPLLDTYYCVVFFFYFIILLSSCSNLLKLDGSVVCSLPRMVV